MDSLQIAEIYLSAGFKSILKYRENSPVDQLLMHPSFFLIMAVPRRN